MENIRKTIISKLYECFQKTDSLVEFKTAFNQLKTKYYQWRTRQVLMDTIAMLSGKPFEDATENKNIVNTMSVFISRVEEIIAELEA